MHKFWSAVLVAALLVGCNQPKTADKGENKDSGGSKASAHDHDHNHDHDGHDHGDDHNHDQGESGEAKALADIKIQLEKAQRELMTKARSLPRAEQARLLSENSFDEYGTELLELASKTERDDIRLQALKIAARMCQGKSGDDAIQALLEKGPYDRTMIGLVRERMMMSPSNELLAAFDTIRDKSDSKEVQGNAVAAQQQLIDMMVSMAGQTIDGAPENINKFFSGLDADALNKKSMELIDLMTGEYADVKMGRSTLGEMAKEKKFIVENLSVGKTAPDIVGKDLDGVEFKLSDYRGKVVLLDFWGDW